MYFLAFWLIKLFRPVIEKSGADYTLVQLIVKCKITMDNRKPFSPNDTRKERNSSFWRQLITYLLFGGMFGMLIGSNPSISTSLFATFSFLMMVSTMSMISDFSTLLLDTRDNTIIIPRPVSERTFLLARIFHITTYILTISLSFSIIPLIVIFIKFNPFAGIVFFGEVLISTLIGIFITHIFYLSLMKYTSGERFKDIIAYFQTALTILFMGGYQLLPRYLSKVDFKGISSWWMMIIPSTWMARTTEVCATFHMTTFDVCAILLGFVVPVLGIWLVIKVLAPGYLRKLESLEQGELKEKDKKSRPRKFTIFSTLGSLVTRTPSENAAFQTIWKLIGRDRNFKQTIFAMMGSVFIMVFILVFQQSKSIEVLRNTSKYLFLIYAPFFFLFSLTANIRYSNNYKSAWIYVVAPISKPGEIISGTYKALIIKIFVPVFILCNSITLYFWGFGFIWQIISGFFLNIFAILLLMLIFKSHLPFSQESKATNSSSKFATSLLMFAISFGLGGFHFLLITYHINVLITLAFSTGICWAFFRILRMRNWNRIEVIG